MKKRYFLQTGAALVGVIALSRYWPLGAAEPKAALQPAAENDSKGNHFEVTKTEAEWRKALTPEQFSVLRKQDTERPFSSPLDKLMTAGTYSCAGCSLPLYSSSTKFDSGTGWPSFSVPLDNAVATTIDKSFWMTRTEIHCRRCGGHLGHVFDDGPPPTGQRYCMNGAALIFTGTAG